MSSGQPRVENGHRPRAEPGVEDVRVLLEVRGRAPADGARVGPGHIRGDRHVAVRAVPGRDAMAPPQLAADTFQSRMSVSQCSQVFSNRSGRMRVRPLRVDSSARCARGFVRMNHCVLSRGSMTSLLRWQRPSTSSCGVVADQVAQGVEVGHDRGAGREAVETVVAGPGPGDGRVVGEHGDRRQAVAQTGLVVVVIVGRRDLHGARSRTPGRRRRRRRSGTSRSTNGMRTRRPTTRGVALVVGMDRDAGVAQDRLGAGRRDGDRRVRVGPAGRLIDEVVADRPQTCRSPASRPPRGR